MKKFILPVILAACAAGGAATANASETATPFADSACPQANVSGRQLNALNAKGQVAADDLVAASQGLVDAYRDCALTFDRLQNMKNNEHQSDYIPVNRMYARLQLARSLQRLGSFADQLHDPAKARVDYDAALVPLAEIDTIVGNAVVGILDKDSAEGRLAAEAHLLHDEIARAEGKLPTPAPTPK